MASVLSFYAEVLEFQGSVTHFTSEPLPDRPFLDQVDLLDIEGALVELLALVSQSGPELLACRAKQLQCEIPTAVLKPISPGSLLHPYEIDDFFRRACLQPLLEDLQLKTNSPTNAASARCPVCGGLPQLSIMRPEGEGGARWLQCSFCLKEWLFRRVVCPWCGEEDKEKLPRYSAAECSHVHVSACDVCKRYLKSVDMTIAGRAVPMVDEVALAALDLWATEHGYQKIVRNILGM